MISPKICRRSGRTTLCVCSLSLLTLLAHGDPVFNPGGNATLIFDSGIGDPDQNTTVHVDLKNPPPVIYQIDASVTGANGGVASGKGSIFAFTGATEFGLTAPFLTGVTQSNPMGVLDFTSAATLSLGWGATWTIAGNTFGPPVYGYGNVPLLTGEVSSGAGSFVSFDFVGFFTGAVTRTPINFHYFNDTPGSFSTGFFSLENTTPDHISIGQMETISGTLTFKAYGVDGLSEVHLGQDFSSVPEPADFAMITAAGLLAAAGTLRWCRSRRPA